MYKTAGVYNASEMTCIVSSEALNSTHSLTAYTYASHPGTRTSRRWAKIGSFICLDFCMYWAEKKTEMWNRVTILENRFRVFGFETSFNFSSLV